MGEDDHVRITPNQRERAVELVRQAASDGRLDFDELNSRVSIGLQARTQGDLRSIISDLLPTAELASVLTDLTPSLEGPGSTWDNPLMLFSSAKDSIKKTGVWEVPPFMEVHCTIWGTVKLDFTEALPLSPLIELVLVAGNGSCTIIVPQGWGVDTERVMMGTQAMFTSSVATRPERGKPRIILGGQVGNGRVRYPKPRELRKIAKRRALEGLPQLTGAHPGPATGIANY